MRKVLPVALKAACSIVFVAIGALAVIWAMPWIYANGQGTGTPLPKRSAEQLAQLCAKYESLEDGLLFDAYIAIREDSVVASCGDVNLPINLHSARKSILSALIGIAIEKADLGLDQSLAELGIDDSHAPLTDVEKSATVRDLLMSRSGIYIEASGETAAMKRSRPSRGLHQPGEFFYYNNWDFNVLGVTLERATGRALGDILHEWIAVPIGMQSFEPGHVIHVPVRSSEHPQYAIFMSAADMARFGMLYLHEGRWHDKQVIPRDWIRESVSPLSEFPVGSTPPIDHFGYSWWVDGDQNVAWAAGWGGQFMTIDRERRLVVVTRQDTGRSQIGVWSFMLLNKYRIARQHEAIRQWTIRNTT